MNNRILEAGSTLLDVAGGVSQRLIPLRVHLSRAASAAMRDSERERADQHICENMQTVFQQSAEERSALQLKYLRFRRRLDLHKVLSSRTDPLPRWLTVTGREYLDMALQEKTGAIILTAHVGYPRLIGPTLHVHGYRMRQVRLMGRNIRERAIGLQSLASSSRVLRKGISNFIGSISELYDIPAELDIRPIVSALANNESVIILGDGLRATDFETFELLGLPYPFPTGLVRIAEMTGATVLPVFAIENEAPFHIDIKISPAIDFDWSLPLPHNVKKVATHIDHQIKSTPHQWHRWKNCAIFHNALEWSKSDGRWNGAFNLWCSKRCAEVHLNR